MEDRWNLRKAAAYLPAMRGAGLMILLALRGFGAGAPYVNGGGGIPAGPGVSLNLAWDLSPSPAVSGYKIYEGTASRNYSVVYDAGNASSAIVSSLQVGTVYFFAATAYDTNGLESDFSAELVYTNSLPSAPLITSIVKSATGNITLSGIAPPSQSYALLAATDLLPPVTWSAIATTVVDAQGTFSITDLQSTNYPQRFYRLGQTSSALIPIDIARGN